MRELLEQRLLEAQGQAQFLTQQTIGLEAQLNQSRAQMQQATGAVRALEALLKSLPAPIPEAAATPANPLKNGAAPAAAGRAGS